MDPEPVPARATPDSQAPSLNPWGYYTPVELPSAAGYQLRYVQLGRDFALLVLARVTDGQSQDLPATPCDHVLTGDTIHVTCDETPVGTVRFDGTFPDASGEFWNNEEVNGTSVVVLRGRLIFERGGDRLFDGEVAFTYYGGH